MIKKGILSSKSLLVLLILVIAQASAFSEVDVVKVEKIVQLNGANILQTNKIQHKCQVEDCGDILYYAMTPEEFEKVSHISFTKEKQTSEGFKYTTQDYVHNGDKFILFKVNIKTKLRQDQSFVLLASVTYLNRYINFPKSIDLSEDQKFEYQDNKKYLSPYNVKEASVTYKFNKLIGYEQDGEKKGLSAVTFRSADLKPFEYTKHRVHGVNNEPQVYFSEVIREIEVSHWGNIAITQFYKIKNVGPDLKGQFSRVQFGSNNKFEAKNAWRGIQTQLPFEIWGLYYRDEVGNISTSRAYRDYSKAIVKVGFAPRYALLGGWKANWEIGYNLKTQGFLKHDANKFQLSKIPLQYGLPTILAQKYTIKLILPEGSANVQIARGTEPIDMTKVSKGVSFGYLDFAGRPTFTVENIKGSFKDQKLRVTYQYDNQSLFKKPILVFVTIFSILLLLVFVKRLNMSAFEQNHAKTN